MPVIAPGRRPAFAPIGRLRSSPLSGGKKGLMMPLNLTAMVDMFTTIVIFLLQSFSANGEILLMQKGLVLPEAQKADMLTDRGPVVTLFQNQVLLEGRPVATLADLDETRQDIEAVTETLKAMREKEEKLTGRDQSKTYDGYVIIQGDKETDFKLVRKAIASLNSAGWAKIKFVVLGAASKEGAAAE